MSKEKTAAWRSMRANQMAETAPRVTGAQEDALHTLWSSEHRELINGKWYVPLSEVTEVLHTTTVEPLSEEWQAKTFPNLNIGNTGKPTPEEDSKRWIRVPKRFKQETRYRIPDRY